MDGRDNRARPANREGLVPDWQGHPRRNLDIQIQACRPLSTRHLSPRLLCSWLHVTLWVIGLAVQFVPASAQQPQPRSSSAAQLAGQDQVAGLDGSIHGVVVDRDGSVCEGARVSLQATPGRASSESTTAPVRSLISDSNGRFNFDSVSPGPFVVAISSEGFQTQTLSDLLHAGESYEAKATVFLLASTTTQMNVNATQEEIAQAEVNIEEKQRIFGAIPNFYVSYAPNAPPLTARQKFSLAEKSLLDPMTFLFIAGVAGIEQADNAFKGYGQGTEGYAKRFGANFVDNVSSSMIGDFLLPVLLKQDPRYFWKGTGSIHTRIYYALTNAVICKGDNGRWQPAYSGILGSLASGGLSNLYYPSADRSGWSLTLQNALIGTGFGAVQNLFQEFLVRKLTPRVPDYRSSSTP